MSGSLTGDRPDPSVLACLLVLLVAVPGRGTSEYGGVAERPGTL